MRILTVLALAAMLVVCIQPAQAEGLSFYGGLGFAKILNDGAPGGSLGITAGAMLALAGAEGLLIGGEIGYLMLGKEEESFPIMGQHIDAEASFAMIPITGQIWYAVPTAGPVTPLLTGGLGIYMLRWSAEACVIGMGICESDSGTETDFGINFGGGLKFGDPDASMKFGADARFHLIMTEDESTKLLTLMARVFF